ncbi:unnamed protein product [Cylindrotheca closterium]|uniref:Nephrocystin-3 n=1 Tax=Cylindrotheca closterium TaxID=2856 RepID=A0AAD2G8T3_9STRA|nr:unnamed protein product [Cylindrotheca closterium]
MVLFSMNSSRSLNSEGSTLSTGRDIKRSVEKVPLLPVQTPTKIDFEGDEALERIVRKLGKFTGVKPNTLIDTKLRQPLIVELSTKRQELFQELLQLAIDERGEVEDWTDKAFATKIIEIVHGTYSSMPPLHPQTRAFQQHAAKFLDCRSRMDAEYFENKEFQQIALLCVQTNSAGIESDTQQYKQQSMTGAPVDSFDELYEAATIANPIFKDTVMRLLDRTRKDCGGSGDGVAIEFPRLKDRERALQKADDDYMNRTSGPAMCWLYDIVRCSIEFNSVDQITRFLDLMKADDSIYIVKSKNRFAQPGLSGYRDLLFHIQISTLHGFKHICEIQIHHKEMKKLDKELLSHFYYEFFRSYLTRDEDALQDRLDDLEVITGEAFLDEHALENLLRQPMEVSEINRFVNLFSDQLGEDEWAMRFVAKLLWRDMNTNGPSTITIANAYDKLGKILQKTYRGKMDEEALLLHLRSLSIKKKELGNKDIALAQTYENIALLHISMDEHLEAMKHLKGALEIKTRNLGEYHLSVAQTYNHMVTPSLQLKRTADVVELCHRSVQIRSSRVGKDHPDLADVYRLLAGAFLRQSKYYDALENYERSLEIRKKLVGENDESLLEDYKGLLHVQFHQGRLNRVQELHQRISYIRLKMSKGKLTKPLPGKHFIKSLKVLRIASAPVSFCLNGFWCRRMSSMGISQKYLKGCFIDEAFEGSDGEDALSGFLRSAHLCLV